MKKALDDLKKVAQSLNAGEAHMKMEMKDKTIAVLSVYDGQRTSHEILDDLIAWAELTNNQFLLSKIEELAKV